MPKFCCIQQLEEGSDREEKERLRDFDNNVPTPAAVPVQNVIFFSSASVSTLPTYYSASASIKFILLLKALSNEIAPNQEYI
jgi:hypothetical protein